MEKKSEKKIITQSNNVCSKYSDGVIPIVRKNEIDSVTINLLICQLVYQFYNCRVIDTSRVIVLN